MDAQTPTQLTTPTVEIYAIKAGTVHLLRHMIFQDGDPQTSQELPAYSYYIYHPSTKTHALFDLGLNKDLDAYPTSLKNQFPTVFKPKITEDAADILERHNIPATSISHVILSHPHFDHCGDPARFPNATVTVGHGTQAFVRPAFPLNPDSRFLEATFPEGRTRELNEEDYKGSVGPYSKAHDFFGDGSFYLLDAPGHMEGHQIGFAKTEKGFVILGGDSCHDLCHLTEYDGGRMSYFMHKDKEKAKENLKRIEELCKNGDTKVCLAHAGEYEEFEKIE